MLNTDNRPYVEFSAPKSTFHYTPHENQAVLLKHYSPIPESLISSLSAEQKELVNNSHQAMKMTLEANIEQDRITERFTGKCKDLPRITRMHQKAMDMSPLNPVIANELCDNMFTLAESSRLQNNLEDAFLGYNAILKHKKTEFWPIFWLFNICFEKGDFNNAEYVLSYGLEKHPNSPLLIAQKGKFLVTQGKVDQGIICLEEAVSMIPSYTPLQNDLQQAINIRNGIMNTE